MINRKLAALSLGLLISICNFLPALAEDAAAPADKPADKSADAPAKMPKLKTNTDSDGWLSGSLHFMGKLPRRLAYMTASTFVGTPFYVARQTKEDTVSGVTDIVGENRNPLLVAPAAALAVPFGIVGGSIGGPLFAAVNGWKHADDDGFTKESLGISKEK